jgi:hypothetical protein
MENAYPQDLLFRRQFFFGLSPFPSENWKGYTMPDGYCLSAHPDLEVTQITRKGFQVTLLGFLLDPARPEDRDEQILNRLCESAASVMQFVELTEPLSGRWVLFVNQNGSSVVLNDGGGLRSIFYHIDADGHAWLASQPGLLSQHFGFSFSPEALQYMQSPRYLQKIETWWPGDSSPYAEVRHLLPNHLLDLETSTVQRFWPTKRLKRVSLQQGVQAAGELLTGTLASAHNRFSLAMSLSSGYDSRLVYAACRDFAPEVYLFSLLYRHLTPESDDIRIPREIARTLNVEHHLVDCHQPMSKEFEEIYTQNVAGSKDDWGSIVEARYNHVPRDRVVLKGNISEIMRCRFWDKGVYPYRVTLRDVIQRLNLGNAPLVVSSMKRWMVDALPVEKLGYKLLDFLSWEIEIGNWMGMAPLFFSLAQEEFSPFSNRAFLNIMLGVDPVYRSYPKHLLEREMVAALWPELAQFPYSPSRRVGKKRFYDGPVLNAVRWAKYLLFEEKHGRLEE